MPLSSLYDMDEPPLSAEEIEAVRQNAAERLSLWRRRGLVSMAAFALSCVFVSLFLEGLPLHAYWESMGKYLMLLSMALLLVCVYCTGLWWGAGRLFRDLKNG